MDFARVYTFFLENKRNTDIYIYIIIIGFITVCLSLYSEKNRIWIARLVEFQTQLLCSLFIDRPLYLSIDMNNLFYISRRKILSLQIFRNPNHYT